MAKPSEDGDGSKMEWETRKEAINAELKKFVDDRGEPQEFKPVQSEDPEVRETEKDEGAERHLFGSKYDDYTDWELHWNTLRNFFPQWMRMRESEDEMTDVYCDMLGPRTQSVKPFNQVAFGEGRKIKSANSTVKSVEAYRMDEMQSLILPQWEYCKPGTQMKGIRTDDQDLPTWFPPIADDSAGNHQSGAVEQGDTEMEAVGENAKTLHRNGKFMPKASLEKLKENDRKEYWEERKNLKQGDEKITEKVKPFLYPYVHYDDNYSAEQFIKSRYINHPHLLPSKFYDRPNDMGEYWVSTAPPGPYGNEDEASINPEWEEARKTVKGRIEITRYLMENIRKGPGEICKLWEKRNQAGPDGNTVPLPYLEGVPALDRTQDKYELATWSWLHKRVYGENEELSHRMIILLINVTVQVLTALCLWGLGFAEINGGRLDVVIVSFTTGIVGLIAGLIGIAGIIAKSEEYLRIFYVAQLWVISVLVSFLYAQARYSYATSEQCGGTNTGNSPAHNVGCDEQTARVIAAIALSVVELFLAWVSVYECSAILDGINDESALQDNIECFKYLQYYMNELLRRCQMKCPAERANRPELLSDYDHVDSLRGPDMAFVDVKANEMLKDHVVEDYSVTCGKLVYGLITDDGGYRRNPEQACYTKEDFEHHFGETLGDRTTRQFEDCKRTVESEWKGKDKKVAAPSSSFRDSKPNMAGE